MIRSRPRAEARPWSSTDLLMLGATLIWGINFTSVKLALREFSPLAFNGLRFSLATITILVILVGRARASDEPDLLRLPRHDWLTIFLLGLTGHTIYQLLFIAGMARTMPANSSLLMATAPIWVAVIGRVLRIERITRTMWAGILLSFTGIGVLVTGGGGRITLSAATLTGDLLILSCAILWTLWTTASKPLLGRYSPLKLTAWTMLAGAVPLVMITMPALVQQDWRSVSVLAWGAVVFSAVLSMAVGYVVWYASVQRVGNARTSVYSYLTPIFAIVVAWVALGTLPSLPQLLGAMVVLAGLVLTRRGRKARIGQA